MAKSIKEQLGMTHKSHALKHRTGEHKMHKTHASREFCSHCGKETSRTTRHDSGHREFDHESSRLNMVKTAR